MTFFTLCNTHRPSIQKNFSNILERLKSTFFFLRYSSSHALRDKINTLSKVQQNLFRSSTKTPGKLKGIDFFQPSSTIPDKCLTNGGTRSIPMSFLSRLIYIQGVSHPAGPCLFVYSSTSPFTVLS